MLLGAKMACQDALFDYVLAEMNLQESGLTS
jgi:hypothetical protein